MTVDAATPTGTLTTATPAAAAQRRTGAVVRAAYGAGGVVAFILLSELIALTGIVSAEYLPPATSVIGEAARLIATPEFAADVLSTLQGWSLAVLLATVIGIPLGILLGSSKVSYMASSVVINLLRPIPAVVLIPLAILVWGNGLGMKVGLAAFGILWPILFNTIYGVRDVDPVARETAKSFGIKGFGIFRSVVIPSAAPFILTGVRIAASLGFIIVVGTELFAGATSGIGAFIMNASLGGGSTVTVIAGAVWAGLFGVVINALLMGVDRRYFAWTRRGVVD